MLVVENQGLPIGGLIASAQPAEVQLAEATLATVKVPRPKGRPRTRPKEVVADKGYDSGPLRRRLRRRGIKPCIPERRGKRPVPGGKPTCPVTASAGRWNGPMLGWATTEGWWCAMSGCHIATWPLFWWLSSSSAWQHF
jgi:hypothetical protein